MARSLDTHVDKLRKRSRILLAHLEENSWKVNQEIKKLYFETSSLNQTSSDQQFHSPRISKFWHLRNNSRGVSGALDPDYFSLSPNYRSASAPIMTLQKRLLLSSKKNEDEIKTRIPVKECYCNRLTRKIQFRSTRTKVKPAPCSHCRSLIDLRPMAWVESNDIQSTNRTPPLSCETLRRIRKINYSPQSQFLQDKLCSTHNLLAEKRTETSSKSDSRHLTRYPSGAGDRVQETFKPLRSSCRNIPSESLHEFNDCSHSNKEILIPSKKASREMLPKRTILSKKASTTSKDEKARSGNFNSEGRSQFNQTRVSRPTHEEFHGEDYFGEYDITPRTSKQTGQFSGKTSKIIHDEDNGMIDLHKFREQNYFDTHGSIQTFLSSRSSGSLERYLLNERLFPQPAGKIHRGDLVVTMPPCATKQRKRIHYFPRYVVKQEKNYETKNQKNIRGCPLTGHAIDVRSLKIQHPSNSLALKFQKGVP